MKKKKHKWPYKRPAEGLEIVVVKVVGDGFVPVTEPIFHVQPLCTCISSSGGSVCSGYRGYFETVMNGKKTTIVKCAASLSHCVDFNKLDMGVMLGDIWRILERINKNA